MLPVAMLATSGTLSLTTTLGNSVASVKLPPLAEVAFSAASSVCAVTVTAP